MSTLTEAQKEAIHRRKYVVLRGNVGQHTKGQCLTGKQLLINGGQPVDPEHIERLLIGRHVREATPEEEHLSQVTLETSDDQEMTSYQARLSRLEAENNTLRNQLQNEIARRQALEAQSRPRPPSPNEQASLALVKAKEDRINELSWQLSRLANERDQFRRDNEELIRQLTEPKNAPSPATAASVVPPDQPSPGDTPENQPEKSERPAKSERKPR